MILLAYFLASGFRTSDVLLSLEDRVVQSLFYPQLKGGNLIRSWPLV